MTEKNKSLTVHKENHIASAPKDNRASFIHTALELNKFTNAETLETKGGTLVKQYQDGFIEADEAIRELRPLIEGYRKMKAAQTGYFMQEAVPLDMKGMTLELYNDLCEAYDVSTPHEKFMLQTAAMSLARYQDNMREFERGKKHIFSSHEVIAQMNMLSKDSDRAFRTYLTIIEYFDAKRNPLPTIHVHTQNAAIAHNQLWQVSQPKQSASTYNEKSNAEH